MKNFIHNQIAKLVGTTSLVATIAVLPVTATNAAPSPNSIAGMVVFGDSLSDTGNFYALTGLPPAPYYEGRFSSGPIWTDYLASQLAIDPHHIANYAIAGATTGRDNENDVPGVVEFPGLQDQLDAFEADLGGRKTHPRTLHIVWAGANDWFISTDPQQTIADGVANTVIAVQRLRAVGARHILVVGLPDLGVTPFAISSGMGPTLSFLGTVYNQQLNAALDQLAANGIPTARLDSATVLQTMSANPDTFGLTNVTDPYLAVGGDPTDFLFWDSVHPTTLAHTVLAEEALHAIHHYFSAWPHLQKLNAVLHSAAP